MYGKNVHAFLHKLITYAVNTCYSVNGIVLWMWTELFEFASTTADEEKLRDFLVVHHVIADVRFCDVCHEECRVERRRKLFRCDRQVTVTGAYKGHQKTFILKELGSRYMVW